MRYLLERLLAIVPVLLGVSLLAFVVVRAVPGDPAKVLAGERASPAVLERIRQEHGFDRPVLVQYGLFLGRLAHGDLGRSVHTSEPVTEEIARRFPATVELALAAVLLAALVGIPLGIAAALRPGSAWDVGSMGVALLGVSLPVFCLGYLLIVVVGDRLPYSGRLDEGVREVFEPRTQFYLLEAAVRLNGPALLDAALHLLLPALALATVPLAVIARITRAAMLEVLSQDWVRTARAKGLAERAVVLRHALRNAAIPLVTVLGMQIGYLLGGAVLTETVFSWPGMGGFVVEAIRQRDYPVIQGGVLLFATTFVLANLIVDLLYARLDPRVRLGG